MHDCEERGGGTWGVVEEGEAGLVSYLTQAWPGCVFSGCGGCRALGLPTCRQTTYEFLANYFIYLLFRIAQIIITYTFIQISIAVNFTH